MRATASADNGNVTEQPITVPGMAHPFVQAYTYDELNRPKIAKETREPDPRPLNHTDQADLYPNRCFDEANTTSDELCSGNTVFRFDLNRRLNPTIKPIQQPPPIFFIRSGSS